MSQGSSNVQKRSFFEDDLKLEVENMDNRSKIDHEVNRFTRLGYAPETRGGLIQPGWKWSLSFPSQHHRSAASQAHYFGTLWKLAVGWKRLITVDQASFVLAAQDAR